MKRFFNDSSKTQYLCLCIIIALHIWGCRQSGSEASQQTSQLDVVRIVNPRELPASLHPTYEVGIPAYDYLHLTLTQELEDHTQSPILLQKLPDISADQTSYTYDLRNDVFWPDGEQLTVSDVVFSIKVFSSPLLNHPAYSPYTEHIEAVRADPDDASRFNLHMRPYHLNEVLTNYIPILSQHVYDPENLLAHYTISQLRQTDSLDADPQFQTFWEQFELIGNYEAIRSGASAYPVGLGPYEVVEWIPEESLTLQRKSSYWTTDSDTLSVYQRNPDHIIFRLMDTDQALRTLRGDVIVDISPASYQELAPQLIDTFHFQLVEGSSYASLAFNTRPDPVNGNPIFTLRRIRQALAHLVPIQEIITARYGDPGLAQPIAVPIAPSLPEADPDITPRTYDPTLANTLLTQLGASDQDSDGILEISMDGKRIPLEFTLLYKNTSPTYEVIAQYFQSAVSKVGIACVLDPVSREVFDEQIANRTFDVAVMVYAFPNNGFDFKQLWHTDSWGENGYNITGFGFPESDRLIEEIRIETNLARRVALSRQFQQLIYKEQPYAHLFTPLRGIAVSKRFSPIEIYPHIPYVRLNVLQLDDLTIDNF